MNRIMITGRLTRAPELKVTDTGTEYCNFSVAVNRRYKDRNGEYGVDYFDCTAWNKTGVFVNQYFHKGDGITCEGRMESRKYVDRDGNNRTAWGVSCEGVEFPIGGKKQNGDAVPTTAGGIYVEAEDDGDCPF